MFKDKKKMRVYLENMSLRQYYDVQLSIDNVMILYGKIGEICQMPVIFSGKSNDNNKNASAVAQEYANNKVNDMISKGYKIVLVDGGSNEK